MKTNKTILIIVSSFFLPLQLCNASYFTMNLNQDSIYTPGNINLTMNLTEEAKIQDNYQFKVSIFLTGTLIREQTIKAEKEKSVNFELAIPEIFERTEGRCRCELLIDDKFLEAQEVPLLLWPEIEPYKTGTQMNAEIWVYDTSGKLLDLFKKMEVKVIDATFKTARDFGKPDIVFVGENTDPNNMRILTNSFSLNNLQPVIIYLRQKQFLKEAKLEVPIDINKSQNVKCDMENQLLRDLNLSDILWMVKNADYLKSKKEDNKDRYIQSCITEEKEDKNNIYCYLCTAKKDSWITIYCQLPITEGNDPRSIVLLKNLLRYAENVNYIIKAK